MPRIRTLEDGGQSAESVAAELVAWLGAAGDARLALYPEPVEAPGRTH